MMRLKTSEWKYYLYNSFVQMRLTRIINILFLTQYANIGIMEFSLLQSIFSFSQFFAEVPTGFLSDYFKKKTIIIWGLILSCISQIIISFATIPRTYVPFAIFIIAFMIEGIARAFISGSEDALFYEKIKEEGLDGKYEKIVGNVQLVVSIVLGVATFLGGVMYAEYFRLPYIAQALFTFTAAIIIMSVNEEKKSLKKNDKGEEKNRLSVIIDEFKLVTQNHKAVFMVLFVGFIFATINTIFGIMPNYLDKLGFSPSSNGFVFMLLSFIGGLVATQSYHFSKLGYGSLVGITMAMFFTGTSLVLLTDIKYVIFLGLVLLYSIIDFIQPLSLKAMNSFVSNDIRATFLSVSSFLTSSFAMILYPLYGSVVEQRGMKELLILVTIITIMLLGIAYMAYRNVDKKKKIGNKGEER